MSTFNQEIAFWIPSTDEQDAGTNTMQELSGADADYGYEYSCEGLMTLSEAAKFLGVHENSVRKYCTLGLLRKGKHKGASGKINRQSPAVICRRSVREYAKSTEI